MQRNEFILAVIFVTLILAGVKYESCRGAPKHAEIVITHPNASPFDATESIRIPVPTIVEGNTIAEGGDHPNEKRLLQFLNSATQSQMQTLPGIGVVLSERIFARRSELGAFSTIQQLLDVNGIGSSKLEHMLEFMQKKHHANSTPSPSSMQPVVPSSHTLSKGGFPSSTNRMRPSLNQVSREELTGISGIGPALADSILAARQKLGRFGTWQDVDQISGIGEHRLRQLQDHFTIP
jgi:competence ComEA-like helix-hairpin-helix protein